MHGQRLSVQGYRDVTLTTRASRCMHTRAHTHLCLRFYSTEDRENKILPSSTGIHAHTHVHTPPAGRGFALSYQQSPTTATPCLISQNYCTDRHRGSTFLWEEWLERGKYKSLILSHKIYTCTHDLMLTHRRDTLVICARTHTLAQTICNIKCFK